MKKRFLILTAMAVLAISGCEFPWNKKKEKDPLVIPNVDVENITLNLPELPEYNKGAIRSDANYDYIDLYELSDFHGAVSYEEHSEQTYLGLKKLATYLDTKRAQNEGGTLVLSSGDMFQGSADSNLTRGYMVNYCMNYMGFDAMAVGNHEFDWTEKWLKNNAELKYGDRTIPYLGANIIKKATNSLPDYLSKSTIIERGEYKIGVIGVIGSRLESTILKSCIQDFDFTPYGDIVTNEANRLRNEENCNAVVVLAHDKADALELFSGVDAIFGGHSHKNFPGSHINNATALATENYGSAVAHISLKFDKVTKECAVDNYDLDVIDSSAYSIADNLGVANIMSQYEPEINKIKGLKLGTTDKELVYDKALKNICVETMFESAVNSAASLEIDSSKIVCALTNVNGGIRDNIKAGDITYGDVYKCFPFDNEIVLLKLKGSYIKSNLAKASSLGIYRVFDKKSYFEDNEDYYIVTTDFLATSDQFKVGTFTEEDLIFAGKIVRDEIAQKIYKIDNVKNAKYDTVEPPFKPFPVIWY